MPAPSSPPSSSGSGGIGCGMLIVTFVGLVAGLAVAGDVVGLWAVHDSPTGTGLVGAGLGIFAGGWLVSRFARTNSATETPQPAVAPVSPDALPAEVRAEIEEHLDRGHLINAIKIYRGATGVDLKTAKDTVESWKRTN